MRSAVARGRHAGPLLLLLAAFACGEPGPPTYEGRGAVREVDAKERQVVIAHEDIPGLMPAMTMNFDVPDPRLLAALAPGQQIRFRVAFDGRSYRIVDADVIGSLEAGESSSSSPTLAGAVAERDVAPPFALTDQDGRPLALADLRGKTILLDFIFTHCTGPCPILTGLQVDVQRALTPEQRAKTHFVSISLDPERDTPEVLRAYARARGADLADWSFLTGPPDAIDAVLRSYGVGIVRKAGEEPAHLVASFVIDGEGRIAHRIIGLEQPATERARLLVSTAGGAS